MRERTSGGREGLLGGRGYRRTVVTTAHRWLTALVVLLFLVALLGGALVWRTHGDRADAHSSQERYGDVLAAADREVTAFVNLRYDDPNSFAAVSAGAARALPGPPARPPARVGRRP